MELKAYPEANLAFIDSAVVPHLRRTGENTFAEVVGVARAEIERLRASQTKWVSTDLCGSDPTVNMRVIALHKSGTVGVVEGGVRGYGYTHWAPIPPLPEKSQEEKDEELWQEYCREAARNPVATGHPLFDSFKAGLKAARSKDVDKP